MSSKRNAGTVVRQWVARVVAYGRELGLIAAYAAICVAVTAPVLVATGGAIYWVSAQLGLEGMVRTGYFALGVVVIMLVFTMLHRFVQALGHVMLGSTRSPMWQA